PDPVLSPIDWARELRSTTLSQALALLRIRTRAQGRRRNDGYHCPQLESGIRHLHSYGEGFDAVLAACGEMLERMRSTGAWDFSAPCKRGGCTSLAIGNSS